MDGWEGALWGMLGGLALEALDFAAVVKKHQHPWLVGHEKTKKEKRSAFRLWLVATLFRIAGGGIAAAAFAASGKVADPLSAFGLGVAAPAVLERVIAIAKQPQ